MVASEGRIRRRSRAHALSRLIIAYATLSEAVLGAEKSGTHARRIGANDVIVGIPPYGDDLARVRTWLPIAVDLDHETLFLYDTGYREAQCSAFPVDVTHDTT